MPVGRLLVTVSDAEEARLRQIVAGELQAHRQAAAIEAARDGQRGQTRKWRGDSEDVVEVHLHRVVDLGADWERRRRRRRAQDHIAALEGLREIARDQAPY